MNRLDLTLPTLAENLALDEALLLAAEHGLGGELLRFWQLPFHAVVLGASGIVADDLHLDACQADGIPIARRSSGGGTVLLGPGCLLYSLILAYDREPALREITSSYEMILGRVGVALAPWLDASSAGSSDLIVAGRKFSGNAQQRKRRHLLHHGTLLCRGCDIAAMSRFLKPPPRQPAYRDERSHDDFLTLLPATPDEVADRLADVWDASTRIDSWPREQVNQLVSEKFGQDEWTFRR